MLTLEGIRLTEGDFTLTADFTLAAGALAAVTGPSGAGKSTLLDVIAGFQAPDAGRVLWRGQDLTPLAPGARPLSMLFQDQNLFPHLTVAQNVGLGLDPRLRLIPAQKAQVAQALDHVGLAGLASRKPAQLSGGQRGRVALARVLVQARPLMLLDEPFAALDPALRAEMLGLIRDLATETGATVLMVTHAPDDARGLGGLEIVLRDGTVAAPVPVPVH